MADKKISELDSALRINNDAVIPLSQDNGGEPTTFKGEITQLGSKLAEDLTFSNLQTTSKTLVGAINELLSLGNPIILGTTAPSSSVGKDGNLYIQYTVGTGGADDTVDDIFIKINGAWCEIQTGGAGGHTIVDNSGTDLAQRTNLQFNGAYSEDNSTNDTTEVFVVRSMTRAQFENLSAAEKVGLINITDESLNATELPISASDTTNTKEYIDSATNGIYHIQSNSSNPAIIENVEAYASMLLIGFAQGIGGVMIALRVHNGSVTNIKDLLNLNAFSNANVTFAYDSQTKEFSIITTSASNSKFTVIVCNA